MFTNGPAALERSASLVNMRYNFCMGELSGYLSALILVPVLMEFL